MNALTLIRGSARNNAWCNQRLHRACALLSEEDYLATRTSFFPSLHKTLSHIVLVDEYYIDGLEGGQRGLSVFRDPDRYETLADITAAQQAADKRLLAFIDALADDAALDREVALARRDGPHVDPAGDILMHLFEHQIHHRGQAHAMLSGTRVAPPQLDEFFLAEDRGKAEAELGL